MNAFEASSFAFYRIVSQEDAAPHCSLRFSINASSSSHSPVRGSYVQYHGFSNKFPLRELGLQSKQAYTCVNLTNWNTIEFRMFRGTLKYNTLMATLQLVDKICDMALFLSDEELKALSWTTFASGCRSEELVQYLKERRLYVNEPVGAEEEV